MQEAPATTATTEAPTKTGGFPPFDQSTFPTQIFWLVIAMVVLFVVMWRFAGPRIKGTLSQRRDLIHKEIETAQENKRKAEAATVAYETPLFQARERAKAINNEYRDKAAADVKKAEAAADASAEKATAEAEARLAKIRAEAKSHIADAAKDATIEIVSRLIGERISDADAVAAVRAAQGS
jgi:F-type H+-transporting ATPase subunit b